MDQVLFFCRLKYKETKKMESESKTFHCGISGCRSHRGKGRLMVLCRIQAHGTAPSVFLKRPGGKPRVGGDPCPAIIPWARQGARVLGCNGAGACHWQSLVWGSSWISFIFSVTASVRVIIALFAQALS